MVGRCFAIWIWDLGGDVHLKAAAGNSQPKTTVTAAKWQMTLGRGVGVEACKGVGRGLVWHGALVQRLGFLAVQAPSNIEVLAGFDTWIDNIEVYNWPAVD